MSGFGACRTLLDVSYPFCCKPIVTIKQILGLADQRAHASTFTARKIGFTLNLILIKVEVKYDYRFDLNFDARQMCVKNVMALPIHLLLDKEEGKRDLTFDSTFDARQRRNQIS